MNPRLRALLGFLAVLSLILWIYGYLNLLVYRTFFKVFPEDPWISIPLSILFWVLAFSFVGGALIERIRVSKLAAGLLWLGALWMGWTWHALLSLAVLKLFFYFMGWKGHWTDLWIAAGMAGFATIFAVWGFWNAAATRVRPLSMVMSKKLAGGKKKVRIAVASDLHMGTIVGRSRIDKLVRMIQALKPDLILFPGDLVDADLPPVLKNNVGKALKRLRAPLGVFAVTGNHEYIGGAEPAIRYLRLHGVHVLRDEHKTLANGIVL
ncbi:MAG: metallophosphoesterase, partial [Spirochaetia bacterium]|nr:metallophosphoesterase [Spirochaetia bacterium]